MTAEDTIRGVELGAEADLTIGPLRVRPSRREVEGPGGVETLEPKVMQTLVLLARADGEVVTRNRFIEACWDGRAVSDDAINRCVSRLRRLGAEHGAFELQTLPKLGYRLLPKPAPSSGGAKPPRLPRWRLAAAVVLLVAALAALAALRLTAPALGVRAPIALGPVTVESADPRAAATAQKLREELVAVFAQQGIATQKPAFGRPVEVRGKVLTIAGKLTARMQLVDPRSDQPMWTIDFPARPENPDSPGSEAAWRVANAVNMLRVALRYGGARLDPATLAIHLQARDNASQVNWRQTTGAAETLRRAPDWPLARASHAMTVEASSWWYTEPQASRLRAQGAEEARDVIARNPEVFMAYVALAMGTDARNWAERERLLAKAASLENEAAYHLANFAAASGRLQDASVIAEQQMTKDPAHIGLAGLAHRLRYLKGEAENAAGTIDRYIAMRPTDSGLRDAKLVLALTQGDPDEALAILADGARSPVLDDESRAALRAAAQARKSGTPADRARAIGLLADAGRRHPLVREVAVTVLNFLGAREEAIGLALVYARDPRTTGYPINFRPHFLFGKNLAPLREDPRFAEVFERLGLADYWRSTGKWPDFCRDEPRSVCQALRQPAQR